MIKDQFDWLREQIKDASFRLFNEVVVYEESVQNLINEAEAKREEDCCEWKAHKYWYVHKTSCGMAIGDYHKAWNFCPYCGKPIKIIEVE